MNRPNSDLMERYGTDAYYLRKCGALSPSAYKALLALAGAGSIFAARADAAHREKLLLEAQLMNQHFRVLQARRMAPVVDSFGSSTGIAAAFEPVKISSELDPKLRKIAQSSGRLLLQGDMRKEALGVGAVPGALKSLLGGAKGLFGRATQRAGRGLMGPTGRLAEEAGGQLTRTQRIGQSVAQRGAGLAERGAATQAVGREAMTQAKLPRWERAGVLSPPPPQAAVRPGAVAPTPTVAPPAPKPPKKPWLSPSTKIGLGVAGAGAIGGAAYLGGKGITTARDYMMLPSAMGGQTWGGYGPVPVHGVNQYGYVTPQF